MFCQACQQFIDDWSLDLQSRYSDCGQLQYELFETVIHYDLDGLTRSSRASCSICRNIWFSLAAHEQQSLPSNTRVRLAIAPDQGNPIIKTSFCDVNESTVVSDRMVAMFLKENIPEDLSQIIEHCSDQRSSESTGSSASTRLSRYWLNDCLMNHERCPKPQGWLPTRVLDVTPDDRAGQSVRLVETSTLNVEGEHRRYVALSHCWGTKRFLTTNQSNYEVHLSQIRVTDLPPSFQDAIHLVQQFGMRYLWIDSLCIIQGSAADWLTESVQMCQVYSQALCTITSAHSEGAFGGIIRKRDGIRSFPFEIQLSVGHSIRRLTFVPTPRREILWDRMDLTIDTRAWCFQEMILSTRNFIFEPDGIRFECLSVSSSERSPDGRDLETQSRINHMKLDIKNLKLGEDIFDRFGDDLQSHSSAWHDVVHDYTARGLTKYSDKLIGVAGVAEAVQARTKYTYLAGHWKELMYLDLCWYVFHDASGTIGAAASKHVTRKPPPYRAIESIAPTWSWASISDVPVYHDIATRGQSMCTIASVEVTGPPHRQTGRLTMQGHTRSFFVHNTVKGVLENVEALGRKYKYPNSHNFPVNIVNSASTMVVSETNSTFSTRKLLPVRFMPDEIIDPAVPVIFIAVCRRPVMSGMSLELRRQTIATLVLVHSGHDEHEYRRVGLAVWDDCSWFGYDCSEDRLKKAGAYRRLSKPWSRLRAPDLPVDSSHAHANETDWTWPDPKYHPTAKMEVKTLTII